MSEAPEAHRGGVGEREQLGEPGAARWRGAGRVPSGSIVAIVAAKDRSDSIAASVQALAGVTEIDRIVVVDDGSIDDTAAIALATGQCEVVRLRSNRGKGGAVTAGFAAAPEAGVYVLIDADLGETASIASALLLPVLDGTADLTIGAPHAAARRGGLGFVKRVATWGIRRAVAQSTTAPLSGQRAISGALARQLADEPGLAARFGLETAMTIDAVRAGARVVEVTVEFEHRRTGRSLAGFAHRGRQGIDIVRALWPRITTSRRRHTLLALGAVVGLVAMLFSGAQWEPNSVASTSRAAHVVVFAMTRLSLDDLGKGYTPTFDRLSAQGSLAATSIRTRGIRPSSAEGYATLGAGDRIRARSGAADAFGAEDRVGLATAAVAAQQRTGVSPTGSVVVIGAAQTTQLNAGKFIDSTPGALGDALHEAGLRTAVVGNSDTGLLGKDPAAGRSRPAAVAVMDANGGVDLGTVDEALLKVDPAAPFGVRVDAARFLAASKAVMSQVELTVLDPGDLDRAAEFNAETTENRAETLRIDAVRRTDVLLGEVVSALPPKSLLLVTSLRPVTAEWQLGPTLLWGPGVPRGYLHSPSTRRLGLITITDLAPTILAALGVDVPSKMIGHALRYHPGNASLGRLKAMNALAAYRERLYLPLTKGYVIFQAILYLLTILLFSVRGGVGRAGAWLGRIVLAVAGLPLATFVFRLVPHAWALGPGGIPIILAIDIALVELSRRRRTNPLAALSFLLGCTVALLIVDLATGARLQQSSVLGYSPHTAARFTGIGNAAFAAFAACATLWAAIHVAYAPRRREAWWTVLCVCVFVALADGAPFLGSDVGGILTLVPVFGLLLYVLRGRRLSFRVLAVAGGATLGALALATGIDLLRPPESRTHLGRLFTSVNRPGGASTFETVILRKLSTNIRVFTGSFWTWMVPIIAIVLLFFLVVQRGWERDMVRGSPLRAGVVAALVAGLLGFVVNDSGVIVAALVFVYLGPYLTLLALAREPTTP